MTHASFHQGSMKKMRARAANVNSSAQNHSGACESLVWPHGPRYALTLSGKLTAGVYLKIVVN